VDLTNNWKIESKIQGEFLNVMFNRNSLTVSLIIMTPIAWLFTLAVFAPSLIEDWKTRIELYSALIVFTPMFIFAIQSFIPARGSPSIPEFLSVILLLLTTCFLLFSLPRMDDEKLLKADKAIFWIAIAFTTVLSLAYFIRLIEMLWLSIFVVIGLLLLLLLTGYYFRIIYFEKRKKHQEAEEKRMFEII
jgi:hypothetical protein